MHESCMCSCLHHVSQLQAAVPRTRVGIAWQCPPRRRCKGLPRYLRRVAICGAGLCGVHALASWARPCRCTAVASRRSITKCAKALTSGPACRTGMGLASRGGVRSAVLSGMASTRAAAMAMPRIRQLAGLPHHGLAEPAGS